MSERSRDAEWLQARLSQCIWRDDETPCRLTGVRICRRRNSHRGTTTVYAVEFERRDRESVEQQYVGYELPPEALDAEYDSALVQATITPPLGRAVTRIPEANLLLVAFPNDRQMRVPGEEALRACLARIASAWNDGDGRPSPRWHVKAASFGVLRYVPGQRLTLRFSGSFESNHGIEQPFAFIAKQFIRPDLAQDLYRSLLALDEHFGGSGAVWLPRPIGFDERTGLVVMEELPGKDLIRALGEVDVGETMWRAGQMLARFHQSPRVVRRTLSVHDKVKDVADMAKKVERFLPAALPRLGACFARCLAVRWTDGEPKVLLHGAFRPKHVFVHDGRLGMIDVDGMCVGHPAHDIGHFLSALYYLEAQELLSAADRSVAVGRVLDGYAASAPWELQPAAVLWCTAALLVHKQARKYVVHAHHDRAGKVDRVLALAEKALTACEGLRPGTSLDVVRSVLC